LLFILIGKLINWGEYSKVFLDKGIRNDLFYVTHCQILTVDT